LPTTHEQKNQPPPQEVSRARAIFNAAEEAKPFNPADFDFAMADEETAPEGSTPSAEDSSPAQSSSSPATPSKRTLGMTRLQLLVIITLAAAFLCILAVFAYFLFFNPIPTLP
jgi:hypothetical protein